MHTSFDKPSYTLPDLLDNNFKNKFFIEVREKSYNDIKNFYHNDEDLLLINGFQGSGKSFFIENSLSFLNPETLIFRFNTYESSSLDDVLLSFYSTFREYHNQKKIFLKKYQDESFVNIINFYFKHVQASCLIIIDSFDNQADDKSLINFLNQIAKFEHIKVIIASRRPLANLFLDIKTSVIKLPQLEKEDFEKFLIENGHSPQTDSIEELHNKSRGHLIHLLMSVYLINTHNISLEDFISETQKKQNFDEFLFKKIISLIPENFYELIWLLSSSRHGLKTEFLKKWNLAKELEIQYLYKIFVIENSQNCITLKDYLKPYLDIPLYTKIKNHKFFQNLYIKELELKPFERELLLSRQTMRKELEFHSNSIPQNEEFEKNGENKMAYFIQANSVKTPWSKVIPKIPPRPKEKQKKKEKFSLTVEEALLLGSENEIKNTSLKNLNSIQNVEEIIQDASEFEKEFEYQKAIETLKIAYEKDKNNPEIITKLALNSKKAGNFNESVFYYKKAKENFINNNENLQAADIDLDLAKLYKDNYRVENAKIHYSNIINNKENLPQKLTLRAYLGLSEIEEVSLNYICAKENLQNALSLGLEGNEPDLLSQIYFKLGLNYDDEGDLKKAKEAYFKCIETSKDSKINTFLSSAYSNLACIFLEENLSGSAVEYFNLSIQEDKKNDNFEGLSFAYSKLAQVFKKTAPELVLKYILKSSEYAKKLNDPFIIANSYIDLGDYYYFKKEDTKALEAYTKAQKTLNKETSGGDELKIRSRINDIKARKKLK